MDEAAECYRACLAINADNGDALYALGMLMLQMESFAEAIEPLSAALELREDPRLAYNLGLAYLKCGQAEVSCCCEESFTYTREC